MPELPEVETVKNTLANLVLGKTIEYVKVLRHQNIDRNPIEFECILQGKTIKSFSRVGKFIVFHLSEDVVMISHLRMEGKYYYKKNSEPVTKHDLVLFYFTDGTYLAYNDTRRFGQINLATEQTYMVVPPLSKVGPDPFMMKDASVLVNKLSKRNHPIKSCLLDQTVMSGLGNIYVDEVLFKCKIHPSTPTSLLCKKDFNNIWKTSIEVLNKAIEAGGSTIKSYHPQQGVSGEFQVQLEVYGKVGEHCPRCGHSFRKYFLNGRGTTYCPRCQKNPALPYVIAITGAIASGKSTATQYFVDHGFIKLDADEIVHELYSRKEIQEDISKFIPVCKVKDGQIDRPSLRAYLLENPNKKTRLEKYIWSKVDEYIINNIYDCKPTDKIVMEVPLLFASHLDDYADDILIIETLKTSRKNRLDKRSSNVDEYEKINASYLAQEDKKKATAVILNNSTVADLYNKLDKFICGK